ncbi:MAG: hypothetical protein M3016_01350 [Actinomycetota bacterium]|nr:hypothetical protein [Actinomycetota bacterium]
MDLKPSLSIRLLAGMLCAGLLAVALPSAATAAPGHFRGVVTKPTTAGRAYKAKIHSASTRRRSTSNMTYHSGPVMHTDANYAIYWAPSGYSFSAGYTSLISQFFGNVAAADGTATNDYSVARQYHDSSGTGFSYGASSGGSYNDTDPYPANGCNANAGSGTCITDSQLQAEVNKFVTAHALPRGLGAMYFVYFPSGVATCFDSSGSQCSTNVYCAYHSSLGSGPSSTLYANMPYAGVPGCESGQYPNGNVAADSVLNVTSHENIEGITDPLGNAWYDSRGNEIGDKCNFNFGAPLGGTAGHEYNEAISTGKYWLQQEWSNANSGCVQHA